MSRLESFENTTSTSCDSFIEFADVMDDEDSGAGKWLEKTDKNGTKFKERTQYQSDGKTPKSLDQDFGGSVTGHEEFYDGGKPKSYVLTSPRFTETKLFNTDGMIIAADRTYAHGSTAHWTYDPPGTIKSADIFDADAKSKSHQTFEAGKRTGSDTTFDNGDRMHTNYDADGKPKSSLRKNVKGSTEYDEYYPDGSFKSELHQWDNGETSKMVFSPDGKRKSSDLHVPGQDGYDSHCEYDQEGNDFSADKTDAKGNHFYVEYYPGGNQKTKLEEITYADGKKVHRHYSPDGKLIQR